MDEKTDDMEISLNTIFKDLVKSDSHPELIKLLLLDKRIDPTANDNAAIKLASKKGYFEIVKILLEDSRVDICVSNNYPVQLASQYGHLEIVKLLLQNSKVNPSLDDNYAINFASVNGHLEIVKILLQDKRVNPSDDNNFAIKYASSNGHIDVVKLLLQDTRVDPTFDNNFAITCASKNGHIDVVKLLIPKVDISKITDQKILDLALEMSSQVATITKDSEKVNDSVVIECGTSDSDIFSTTIAAGINLNMFELYPAQHQPLCGLDTPTTKSECIETNSDIKEASKDINSKEEAVVELLRIMKEFDISRICTRRKNECVLHFKKI